MSYRFDPPQDLTMTEITQLFRDMYKDIPDNQLAMMQESCPIFAQYLIKN